MTIGKSDYSKIKTRYAAHQQSAGGREGWWKPEPGRHRIRILPPPASSDSWYMEYAMHYGLSSEDGGSLAVVCPKVTLKKPCPICEFCVQLFKTRTPADEQMGKKFYRKMRYVSNIVVLSKDAKEAKLWSYGPTIYTQIADINVGNEGGILPIDDPDNGYNLSIGVTTKSTPEGQFPQYRVQLDGAPPKPLPLPDKGVLTKIKDFVATIHGDVKSYDELKSILLGGDVGAPAETTAKTTVDVPGTNEVIETDETTEESGSGEDEQGARETTEESNAEEVKPVTQPVAGAGAPARTAPADLVAKARAIAAKQRK